MKDNFIVIDESDACSTSVYKYETEEQVLDAFQTRNNLEDYTVYKVEAKLLIERNITLSLEEDETET